MKTVAQFSDFSIRDNVSRNPLRNMKMPTASSLRKSHGKKKARR